jgi:hypothetical protein
MKNRWTLADIERLGLKAQGIEVKKAGNNIPYKIPRQPAKQISEMCLILHAMGIDYVTEHRFHDLRKFRFDIAILDMKVGIEYEGLMSEKSRHTTIEGFTMDCIKYNLAVKEGWRVMRYTAKNYQSFGSDIQEILKIEL